MFQKFLRCNGLRNFCGRKGLRNFCGLTAPGNLCGPIAPRNFLRPKRPQEFLRPKAPRHFHGPIGTNQRHPVFSVALSVNGSEISEAIQIGKILINFNSTFQAIQRHNFDVKKHRIFVVFCSKKYGHGNISKNLAQIYQTL